MNKTFAIAIGIVLLIGLLLFSTTFTVNYHQLAIKTRFGRTDDASIIKEAGLKFRLPFFADKVTPLDKRLQLRESPLQNIETSDRLQVVVRAYMLWQVDEQGDGPLRFFQHYETIDGANAALNDTFRNAVNSGVSKFKFDDLIGPHSQVKLAEDAIANEMKVVVANGIKPVMVGISQIVLPPKTSTAVLGRMLATNKTISETERIKGDAEAKGIQNRASQIAAKIEAFAKQRAEEIKQAGSEQAAAYLKTMSQDQGLAVFLSWLDALKESLAENTTVVIPTVFAPFHMMQLNAKTDARGIPVPNAAVLPDMAAPKPDNKKQGE
jgi:regulator of protease activity HflC (stomatin/prohibitin superfamily)